MHFVKNLRELALLIVGLFGIFALAKGLQGVNAGLVSPFNFIAGGVILLIVIVVLAYGYPKKSSNDPSD